MISSVVCPSDVGASGAPEFNGEPGSRRPTASDYRKVSWCQAHILDGKENTKWRLLQTSDFLASAQGAS